MLGLGLNGLYELSFLKTITVVGTGEVKLALGKTSAKTWRNCCSRFATCRTSFSLALPTRKKCFVRTLIQLSFALAVVWAARIRNSPTTAPIRRFLVCL